MAHREQTESILHRAVQTVLSRGLNDPRVRGLVSVTGVKVAPDLANATVMISVLPAEHASLTLRGIQHASAHIRGEASELIRIRRMPKLAFRLDDGLKRESETIAAINAVNENEGDDPDEDQMKEHDS